MKLLVKQDHETLEAHEFPLARPAPTPVQLAALLCERSARYMEVHGWVQRHYVTNSGSVCLRGAMQQALALMHVEGIIGAGEAEWIDVIAQKLVRRAIQDRGVSPVHSLESYNDGVLKHKHEAVELLYKAAAA